MSSARSGVGAERHQRRDTSARVVALVAGVLAVVTAVALPLVPVTVNQPTVSWPRDPQAPESTVLMLTAYRPTALDVRFSCQAARLAASTSTSASKGLLLSTVAPAQPPAADIGLVISVMSGRVAIDAAGTRLVDEPLLPGECSYRITGGAQGLVVTRDGRRVAVGPADRVPEVEALVTDLRLLPGASADDLSVRIEVDDQFSTSPTPGKLVVILLAGIAVLASLVAAGRLDRARVRGPTGPWRWRPGVADLVVLVTLVAWLFLAPMTDDDGYYGAMAENAPLEGYVANYYQLYNQSFTPFTWVYMALSGWGQLVGTSPALLRIPALLCGLTTWVLLRRFVSGCLTSDRGALPRWFGGRRRWLVRGVLAVAFLVWWLPQDMGVRPEVVVALAATGALLAVAVAVERHRLTLAGLGVGVAALGFAAHPTGLVALAPLLAAAPALWSLVRGRCVADTVARAACVLAPGAVGAIAGFADSSLRDFLLSQQIFLGIQDQESWYNEYSRYGLLLAQIAMGSYAKRAAVLVALLALVWFLVLLSAARARNLATPQRLSLAGWSLGLSLLLLWPTPSKWTHHFGALAGVGPAFLALFLVFAPPLVFQLARGRRLPAAAVGAAVGSVVLTVALAGHGPNDWPYAWMFGMPHASSPPYVGRLRFDQPLWWLLGLLVVAAVLALWWRRRAPRWTRHAVVVAVPVLVVGFFVATLGYLLGSFGLAAAHTWDTYSLGAANLADPLSTGCPSSHAVEVADEQRATPLPTVASLAAAPPGPVFVEGTGWLEGVPPPVAAGAGAAAEVWGSFVPRAGTSRHEENVGSWASSWYQLPADRSERSELAVLVAGQLGAGNSLTAEYGVTGDAGVRVLSAAPIGAWPAPVISTAWRAAVLDGAPTGADAVRIVAEDSTTNIGGWLAFTAPAVHPYVPLEQYVTDGAAVGVSWQFALKFPCLRQPRQQDGVTEPVSYAVLWGEGPLGGLDDGSWQKFRGGAFARIPVVKSVFQPASRFRDFPDQPWLEVYRFPSGLAADAYELSRQRTTVTGW